MKIISGKTVYDTFDDVIDPRHAAIIVVDVQNDFCHERGHFPRNGKDISMIQKMIPNMSNFVKKIRAMNLFRVFIQQTTFAHGLSDSSAWLRFKTRDGKTSDYSLKNSWGWKIIDELEVQPDEMTVEKFRPDAFVYTPLDLILRVNRIETTVIMGVITQGCVESTVRGASYHDYHVVVVEDCIASTSSERHQASMDFMKSRYDVVQSLELIKLWEKMKG